MNRYYDEIVNFLVSTQILVTEEFKMVTSSRQSDERESEQLIRICCFLCFASNISLYCFALKH